MPYARVKNELPHIPGYASGDIVSFSDGYPGAPVNTLTADVSGSGCKVTSTGKNLFDKNAVSNNKWLSTTTGLEESASGYVVSDYIPVKSGKTVFIPTSGTARRWYYDINKNPVTYLNNSGNQAFTPTADGYIRVTIQVTGASPVDLNTFQIEFGSEATSYEPFGQTYSIIFPSSVDSGSITIHSDGSVDLTSEGTTTRLTDTAKVTTLSGLNYIWVDAGIIENLVYIRRLDS